MKFRASPTGVRPGFLGFAFLASLVAIESVPLVWPPRSARQSSVRSEAKAGPASGCRPLPFHPSPRQGQFGVRGRLDALQRAQALALAEHLPHVLAALGRHGGMDRV